MAGTEFPICAEASWFSPTAIVGSPIVSLDQLPDEKFRREAKATGVDDQLGCKSSASIVSCGLTVADVSARWWPALVWMFAPRTTWMEAGPAESSVNPSSAYGPGVAGALWKGSQYHHPLREFDRSPWYSPSSHHWLLSSPILTENVAPSPCWRWVSPGKRRSGEDRNRSKQLKTSWLSTHRLYLSSSPSSST